MTSIGGDRPQRVGPYRLDKRLGAGGMGVVYLAFDERLERQVALKKIRPEVAANHRTRDRFRREARSAARLNHPNVVKIHDLLTSRDGDWIVMELVEGRSLDRMLATVAAESRAEGTSHLRSVIALAVEITHALAAAHAEGIVHRDLKAKNVLVTADGHAKVLDFGLAKQVLYRDGESTSSISIEGQLIGTPHAMSPEQAMARRVDLRSDLFSLGTLLYEMVTGVSPFRSETPADTITRVCLHHPPPVTKLSPGLPQELSELIRRLLEKDPAKRPPTATEVAVALRRIADAALDATTSQRESPITDEATIDYDQAPVPKRTVSERRQVTVMCLELVAAEGTPSSVDPDSSSKLHPVPSSKLDPEPFYAAMADFESLVREVVENDFDGHVANVLGHRLVVYFGYPQAHEDDAGRAVRTALQLLPRIEALTGEQDAGYSYSIRIGIHTGPTVVLGSGSAERQMALGQTLDLALALQKLAEPGEILVGDATRRLVKSTCSLDRRSSARIGGASEPTEVFQVRALKEASSPSRAGDDLTPLVGRERELTLLIDHLDMARQGHGQVVMVSGEAGIGKSRLVQALHQRIAQEPLTWLDAAGSAYAVNTPFAPISELLLALFELEPRDEPAIQFDKLESGLERHGLETDRIAPYLAMLLAMPFVDRYPLPKLTPDQQRQRILEALSTLFVTMARRQPVLMVFEDLHWVDPSTLELLELLIEQCATACLLLIMTFRPEFEVPWTRQTHLTQLALNRLPSAEAVILIDRVTQHKSLPDEVRDEILAKTDGVPLFVEELTKNILESGYLRERDDRYQVTGTLADLNIPATLRESLTARLDRLGTAKEVAQLAAVIGREFSHHLLLAVSPLEATDLESELTQLVTAGLVHRKGFSSQRRFIFKHALVQDAAYDSLLKTQCRRLHLRIAETLAERFPEISGREPELLAHHFERAARVSEAITYRQLAGQRAADRSAHVEAMSHFQQGVKLVETLPTSSQRSGLELELLIALGVSSQTTKGYGAKEVEAAYSRAVKLSAEVGGSLELFKIAFGQWMYSGARGYRRLMLDSSRRLLQIAAVSSDIDLEFQAYSFNGLTQTYTGSIERAARYTEQALTRLDSINADRLLGNFGDETIVLPHTMAIWRLCLCGPFDKLHKRLEEMFRLVESHRPFAMAMALLFGGVANHHLRNPGKTLEYARRLVDLCEEGEYLQLLAFGKGLAGWASFQLGEHRKGLEQMQEGLDLQEEIGNFLSRTYWLSMLAESLLEQGETEEALETVDQALKLSRQSVDRYYRCELYRLRGEILRHGGDDPAAERHLRLAIATSRRAGKRHLELRSAVSLARLLADRGELSEIRTFLSPPHHALRGDFDVPILRQAKDLLDRVG